MISQLIRDACGVMSPENILKTRTFWKLFIAMTSLCGSDRIGIGNVKGGGGHLGLIKITSENGMPAPLIPPPPRQAGCGGAGRGY